MDHPMNRYTQIAITLAVVGAAQLVGGVAGLIRLGFFG